MNVAAYVRGEGGMSKREQNLELFFLYFEFVVTPLRFWRRMAV